MPRRLEKGICSTATRIAMLIGTQGVVNLILLRGNGKPGKRTVTSGAATYGLKVYTKTRIKRINCSLTGL
jgi:hypothetical protein